MQNVTQKQPHECTDITQVRDEIDRIDQTIIDLLSLRFRYVREVVKYKAPGAASIEAPERRQAVLQSRRQWAEGAGLNPDVIEGIYRDLIQYFIDEEKKIQNKLIR